MNINLDFKSRKILNQGKDLQPYTFFANNLIFDKDITLNFVNNEYAYIGDVVICSRFKTRANEEYKMSKIHAKN